MPKSQIDAAALLAAIVAGALALMLLPGPFVWLSSIGGLILLFIVLSFDREGYRTVFQSLAFAAVFGFCLMLASAVLLQLLAGQGELPSAIDNRVSRQWMPLVWVCATAIFWGIDRARMSGREGIASEAVRGRPAAYRTFVPEFTPAAAPPPTPTAAPSYVTPATPPPSTPAPERPEPATREAPVPSMPTPVAAPTPPPPPPAAVPTPTVIAPPPKPGKEAMIYVTLLGEGLNMLRSVKAEHLGRDYYRIVDSMPEGETWEYQPGQVVRCKKKNLSSGKALVAIEEAPRAS